MMNKLKKSFLLLCILILIYVNPSYVKAETINLPTYKDWGNFPYFFHVTGSTSLYKESNNYYLYIERSDGPMFWGSLNEKTELKFAAQFFDINNNLIATNYAFIKHASTGWSNWMIEDYRFSNIYGYVPTRVWMQLGGAPAGTSKIKLLFNSSTYGDITVLNTTDITNISTVEKLVSPYSVNDYCYMGFGDNSDVKYAHLTFTSQFILFNDRNNRRLIGYVADTSGNVAMNSTYQTFSTAGIQAHWHSYSYDGNKGYEVGVINYGSSLISQVILQHAAEQHPNWGSSYFENSNRSRANLTTITIDNPPSTPQITYPNGGEKLKGIVRITSSLATDDLTPQNQLKYQFAFTTNGGSSWVYSGWRPQGQNYWDINLDSYPESTQCIVAVQVYDGQYASGWDWGNAVFTNDRTPPSTGTGATWRNYSNKADGEIMRFHSMNAGDIVSGVEGVYWWGAREGIEPLWYESRKGIEWNDGSAGYDSYLDVPIRGEGTYFYVAHAKDNAGNGHGNYGWSQRVDLRTIIDRQAPKSDGVQAAQNTKNTTGTMRVYNYNVRDESTVVNGASGIENVQWWSRRSPDGGTTWEAWQHHGIGGFDGKDTWYDIPLRGEGKYEVHTRVYDKAGNVYGPLQTEIVSDVTPATGVVSTSTKLTNGTTFDVYADFVRDSLSSITNVKFQTWTINNGQDDMKWYDGIKDNISKEYKYEYSQNMPWSFHGFDIGVSTSYNYTYSFDAYISEDANIGSTGTTFIANGENGFGWSFDYDNTRKGTWQHFEVTKKPTTSTSRILLYPTAWTSTATTGRIIYSNVSFKREGTTTNLFPQVTNNSEFTVRGNGIVESCDIRWKVTINKSGHISEEGEYITQAYAYDSMGNSGMIGTVNVKIDNSGPTGSIKINNNEAVTNYEFATLTLTASDSISSVKEMRIYNSITDTGWITFNSNKQWTLVGGNNTVKVKYRDEAGNESIEYSKTIKYEILPTLNTPTLSDEIYKGFDTVLSAAGTNVGSSAYRIYYTTKLTAPTVIDGGDDPGTGWTDTGITGAMNIAGTTNVSITISSGIFDNIDWTYVVFKVAVASGTGNWLTKYTTAYNVNNPNDEIGYVGHNQIIKIYENGHEIVVSNPTTPVKQYGPYSTSDINALLHNNTFENNAPVKYRLEFDVVKTTEITKLNIYFDYNLYNKDRVNFTPIEMILQRLNDNGSISPLQTFTTNIQKEDGMNRYFVNIDQSKINTIGRYFLEYKGQLTIESNYLGGDELITNYAEVQVITNDSSVPKIINGHFKNRKARIDTNITRNKIQYQ